MFNFVKGVNDAVQNEKRSAGKRKARASVHAQDIYKEAFNSAWDQYKDKDDRRDDASREETAHKVAWAAVKHEYAKGDDDKWHKKS